MIWYFLYPFRGTTNPPVLSATHPLRRSFTRYGSEASRHPVVTLLISVAVAVVLVYPFPFLYTNNFTNGSSNLPHHVWTAAQPYEGDVNMIPDVVMRSIWVHGSFMKALNSSVLQAALEVQDELLGPTIDFNPKGAQKGVPMEGPTEHMTIDQRNSLHAVNGLNNQSWFFNSPLLYWSCSSDAIAEDEDVVATVNERSRRATSVNVTLRHSIVFSGKRFEDHRLVAADALVITLIHKLDSPVAREWEKSAESLARRAAGQWLFYPKDGRVVTSQLYEFRFQPLSFQDDIVLGIAYSLTICYFLLSLTRLRALKSRFGLSVAVITQIGLSIMSSFTICAVFKIDLSKIPREAYPLVVLTVGLENMFRLINAVIITPSESPTIFRIAEAVGQTGHIALAGVAQNLFILWMLHKVVSPGVAAFCIFAAMALAFDFLYLFTFFVAVLSVEVRRTELSDALGRNNPQPKIKPSSNVPAKHNWSDALLRGDLPISTRISGTIVLIGFVLVAQWHFFDNENLFQTLSRLVQLFWVDHRPAPSAPTILAVDVNQARSPTAWLRLQDHETAHEVIKVVKPHAHSFIARVYDPLILVLQGSDRTPSRQGIRSFLPAAYDFLKHQTTQFFMSVCFTVAAVSLLMNYLLWDDEEVEVGRSNGRPEDEPLLAVITLGQGHALDVAMLAASPEGLIVSVGLDRLIRAWNIRHDSVVHQVDTRNQDREIFPVMAVTVDEHANWIALLSSSGSIMLWNIRNREWRLSVHVEINGRPPLAFVLVTSKTDPILSLLLVRSNGQLTEIAIPSDKQPEFSDVELSNSVLTCARPSVDMSSTLTKQPCIIMSSRRGNIYIATKLGDGWFSEAVELHAPEELKAVLSVLPLPTLRLYLAIRQDAIDLVDLESSRALHTFTDVKSHPSTVRSFHAIRRAGQTSFNSLESFSIVYTDRESGECILQNFSSEQPDGILCIDSKKFSKEQISSSWDNAVTQVYRTKSPGKWEALPVGIVLGVRKREDPKLIANGSHHTVYNLPYSDLRRRGQGIQRLRSRAKTDNQNIWEAWTLSATGERSTIALDKDEGGSPSSGRLLVSSCGPIARVGQRSVAVGLGNVIKVITFGHESFNTDEDSDDIVKAMSGRRRKPATMRKQSMTPSW